MTYKFLLVLPIIALLGVIPTAVFSQTDNQQQQQSLPFFTYVNSTYGITIKYPSTWVKEESHDLTASGDIVKFSSPATAAPASLNIVGGIRASQTVPLQEYVDAAISDLKQNFNNFNLIASNSTSLAGFPAHELVYTAMPPSSALEIKFMQILTIKDSKSFVITFGTLPTNFPTYLPTIQKMVDSFKFVPIT